MKENKINQDILEKKSCDDKNNTYSVFFLYSYKCGHCNDFKSKYQQDKEKIIKNSYIDYYEIEVFNDKNSLEFLKTNLDFHFQGVPVMIFCQNNIIQEKLTMLGNNIKKFKNSLNKFAKLINDDKFKINACDKKKCGNEIDKKFINKSYKI